MISDLELFSGTTDEDHEVLTGKDIVANGILTTAVIKEPSEKRINPCENIFVTISVSFKLWIREMRTI